MSHTRQVTPELSSGAMADIAFLLLTFYMVTTEIKEYKGLPLLLPPFQQDITTTTKNDRNVFAMRINSNDQFLIEGEVVSSLEGVRQQLQKFIMNNGEDRTLSDSPMDAVVSIKTDRGSSYGAFIKMLDEAQAAYYEIYAERAGVSTERFRKLKINLDEDRVIYEKGRTGIPMNISIAESN